MPKKYGWMIPMYKNWKDKYISLFIVLIAFVDGMLVAQQFQSNGEGPLAGALILEDKFEQKMSSIVEPEKPVQDLPFVVQAPYGVWSDPWASFAEEATAYMAYLWANNLEAQGKEIDGQALLEARDWELVNLETYKDTDLEQTLRLLNEFYRLRVELSYDVNLETMQAALDEGKILIIPIQNLDNPYYGKPGPVSHMLIIYGYEEGTFLTNDPGTIRGDGYSYANQKILESIQDLNGEDRVIVVFP